MKKDEYIPEANQRCLAEVVSSENFSRVFAPATFIAKHPRWDGSYIVMLDDGTLNWTHVMKPIDSHEIVDEFMDGHIFGFPGVVRVERADKVLYESWCLERAEIRDRLTAFLSDWMDNNRPLDNIEIRFYGCERVTKL